MRVKLDANLGQELAQVFRQEGHDVATVAGQNLCGTEDRSLIEMCRQEQRGLISLDMDFSNPLIFDPRKYSGIAVLRLAPRSSSQDILDLARTLIQGLTQQDITGKLWIVQREKIREYQSEITRG